MLHLEIIEATIAAGKAVFCEKPVGGMPAQTLHGDELGRAAGVITGVGTIPLGAARPAAPGPDPSRRARHDHELSRPLLLDVRQRPDGPAVVALPARPSRARRQHRPPQPRRRPRPLPGRAGDRRRRTTATFIPERPLARPGAGSHYARGAPGDPAGRGHQRGLRGCAHEVRRGRRRHLRSRPARWGAESEHAFEVYGTNGALKWNLERLNELRSTRSADHSDTGYTTVFGGDRFPYHGNFVPGAPTRSASKT